MYIDTHCHITRNDYNDIPFLINKIKESGVNKIIVNGCDMESNLEVLELTKKYDIVYGALGFHPTELEEFDEDNLLLSNFLSDNYDDSADELVNINKVDGRIKVSLIKKLNAAVEKNPDAAVNVIRGWLYSNEG